MRLSPVPGMAAHLYQFTEVFCAADFLIGGFRILDLRVAGGDGFDSGFGLVEGELAFGLQVEKDAVGGGAHVEEAGVVVEIGDFANGVAGAGGIEDVEFEVVEAGGDGGGGETFLVHAEMEVPVLKKNDGVDEGGRGAGTGGRFGQAAGQQGKKEAEFHDGETGAALTGHGDSVARGRVRIRQRHARRVRSSLHPTGGRCIGISMKRLLITGLLAALAVLGADATTESAKKKIAEGKYEEAVTELDAAYQKNPKSAELKKALAGAHFAQGDATMKNEQLPPMRKYPAALRSFRKAVALDPGHAEAKNNIKAIEDVYKSMGRPVPQ